MFGAKKSRAAEPTIATIATAVPALRAPQAMTRAVPMAAVIRGRAWSGPTTVAQYSKIATHRGNPMPTTIATPRGGCRRGDRGRSLPRDGLNPNAELIGTRRRRGDEDCASYPAGWSVSLASIRSARQAAARGSEGRSTRRHVALPVFAMRSLRSSDEGPPGLRHRPGTSGARSVRGVTSLVTTSYGHRGDVAAERRPPRRAWVAKRPPQHWVWSNGREIARYGAAHASVGGGVVDAAMNGETM